MTSKKIVRALRELAEETGLDAPQALNYNALCFSQGEARLDRDRAVQDSCIAHLRDRRAEMDDSADVSEGHRNLRQHIATHVRGEVEAFPFKSTSRNATNSNEPFARSVPVPSSCARGRHHKML